MITNTEFNAWLAKDGEVRCVLVEVEAFSGGTVVTRYLSNTHFDSRPSDSPANQGYDDILIAVPRFKSSIGEALGGITSVSMGDIDIDNAGGERDAWLSDAWDGRAVRLYLGSPSWPKADFRLILAGVAVDIVAKDASTLTLKISDKQQLLNGPVQKNLIGAGTPNAQKPIPLAYGEVYNIEPLLIDSATRKYQVHDGRIEAITVVYDNGKSIAFTADLNAGTFTLAAAPVGRVTADVKGCKLGGTYITRTADIVQRILTTRTPLTAGDLDSASFAALNSLCPQTVGIYIGDRRNSLNVLDELLKSVGGFYGFGRNGQFKLGRLDAPTGIPVIELIADDVEEFGLTVKSRTLPVATLRLGYKRNFTVQADGLDATVTPARKAELADEYQVVSAVNAGITTAFLSALSPDIAGTLLVSQSDAQAEANRRAVLFNSLRYRYSLRCFTAPAQIELGQMIRLTHPRYGFTTGALAVVIGIDESPTANAVTLELWR